MGLVRMGLQNSRLSSISALTRIADEIPDVGLVVTLESLFSPSFFGIVIECSRGDGGSTYDKTYSESAGEQAAGSCSGR
jgi:hypothetical protein